MQKRTNFSICLESSEELYPRLFSDLDLENNKLLELILHFFIL